VRAPRDRCSSGADARAVPRDGFTRVLRFLIESATWRPVRRRFRRGCDDTCASRSLRTNCARPGDRNLRKASRNWLSRVTASTDSSYGCRTRDSTRTASIHPRSCRRPRMIARARRHDVKSSAVAASMQGRRVASSHGPRDLAAFGHAHARRVSAFANQICPSRRDTYVTAAISSGAHTRRLASVPSAWTSKP